MGAWGYGPYDNDTALDYQDALLTPEDRRKALMSDDESLVLLAATLIAGSQDRLSTDEVALASRRVREVCLSPDQLDSWDDAESRQEAVQDILDQL